ncbi:uncharacterized protein PV07_00995 [Cladophialophora immunda]|uniref:Uncharacterized protein n=1 Tax=Cladophialophora immunda TaxID=569365 RepID=A0A0D2B9B3_9EURO|nr:uncharacterized protein PV07_00995 [Cladophialophora immunda]KIW34202.1 hypothetical protein PV07_00995 [Cladophialophora immunda]
MRRRSVGRIHLGPWGGIRLRHGLGPERLVVRLGAISIPQANRAYSTKAWVRVSGEAEGAPCGDDLDSDLETRLCVDHELLGPKSSEQYIKKEEEGYSPSLEMRAGNMGDIQQKITTNTGERLERVLKSNA